MTENRVWLKTVRPYSLVMHLLSFVGMPAYITIIVTSLLLLSIWKYSVRCSNFRCTSVILLRTLVHFQNGKSRNAREFS